jgi:subtilisin family serine protease
MKRSNRLGLVAGAVAFACASAAVAAPRSYVVVAKDALPAGLERQVAAAGGTLRQRQPALGLAEVVSERPDFAARAARIAGVAQVLPNVRTNWLPDRGGAAVESAAPGIGADERFFPILWGLQAIDAPGAWALGARGAGATVAVLDEGFDTDHPDLAPNVVGAVSMVDGETVEYSLPDPFSHGTHVAGTIAAADNGLGVIGVAPEAKLLLVKVLADGGSGSFLDVVEGLVYAADYGVDVINMSLGAALPRNGYVDDNGTPGDPSDDVKVGANEVAALLNLIGRATSYAHARGATIVASAGNDANDGNRDKALVHTPADAPHVIAVSATAPVGWAKNPAVVVEGLASYSNYGASAIDLSAPGGDSAYPGNETCTFVLTSGPFTRPCWLFDLVFSTGSQNAYYWSAGTSMAAPHVSGVAALVVGRNGGSMPPAQVEATLKQTADDLGKPGHDAFYGAGRVNARRAVQR